ncbi:hypothetical protein NDA01_26860 [Trichocoleus desertorum AS-A10]
MEDEIEKLLAQQAETIARLKDLLGQIRGLVSRFQDLKQENELHHPFCGCCNEQQGK